MAGVAGVVWHMEVAALEVAEMAWGVQGRPLEVPSSGLAGGKLLLVTISVRFAISFPCFTRPTDIPP